MHFADTCDLTHSSPLLLERDGVVEEEVWSGFENIGDGILREVPIEGSRYIGEYEGDVAGQGFREPIG